MSARGFCGFCGADWRAGAPLCACRRAGERASQSGPSALERFAVAIRLGLSPELAADLATGRLAMEGA